MVGPHRQRKRSEMHGSVKHARAQLSARLMSRRSEIEQAAIARVHAVAGPSASTKPDYAQGLRTAISVAIDHAIDIVERGERGGLRVPPALLMQARLAARSGVPLDTVLRRYFAGYTLLGDFIVEEAHDSGLLATPTLKSLLRVQAASFDHLVAMITEEYLRESENCLGSNEERRAGRIERLLAGDLIDTSGFDYDFGAHHVGLIALGPDAQQVIRKLAEALDRRLLIVRHADGVLWAWLGGRRGVFPSDVTSIIQNWSPQLVLTVGEATQGRAGWRFTHQQAQAALPIALGDSQGVIRYADVALLASMLRDDLLRATLHDLYLVPLSRDRNGGSVLRQTLRAYFAAERNVSSAAAALGVSRQTISNRLQVVEERLDRPLNGCAAEIEAALRLESVSDPMMRLGTVPLRPRDTQF